MKLILFFLSTIFSSIILLVQNNKYDTLFILNKKYVLKKTEKTICSPFDFPFAIAECQYEHFLNKDYEYSAMDISGCAEIQEFFASGNYISAFKCESFKIKSYSLYNLLDSLEIDLSKLNQSKIYLKQGLATYFIEKIQFKLIYDSTIAIINPDLNQKNDNFYIHLKEAVGKRHPRFIILNEMMYTDKKNKLHYIPRQFILRLKEIN